MFEILEHVRYYVINIIIIIFKLPIITAVDNRKIINPDISGESASCWQMIHMKYALFGFFLHSNCCLRLLDQTDPQSGQEFIVFASMISI